jgi:hypothetical protein
MTPRVAWALSLLGLALNAIGASLLIFCPPATVMHADGGSTLVVTWDQDPGFYAGMLLFISGFVVQFIALLSQRP